MVENINLSEEPKEMISMHPQKFGLWLFMASVLMLFAAFTSAYIVRQGEGNWLEFDLPPLLSYTTVVIVLSSISLHWSYLAAKKDNLKQVKSGVVITAILGAIFLVGQVTAWGQLVEANVFFVGNPAGSFLYILTGIHGLHLVSAVIFLIFILIATFKYEIHSKNMARMDMCVTYWHFLGALWIYLFIFLQLNH